MAGQPGAGAPPPIEQAICLRSLLPPQGACTVPEIVERLGLWDLAPRPSELPHLLLNMVCTVDGRATLAGRSGPISDAADRALFHGLRAAVDAVLVGAGTVRTERYGRIIRDHATRELRRRRGRSEEPLACIVSGRLALDEQIPLLLEPQANVVLLTASAASLPASGAHLEYIRSAHDGHLDLRAGLMELRERFAVNTVLCEGGPHLCEQLLAAGLVDELFLSLAPKLAGGEPAGGEALRIVAGAELDPPVEMQLLGALQEGSRLFLRYGVSARARVSRETIESSSLAS
jgi:riboflavin biosynthesis pyrimidine reductase